MLENLGRIKKEQLVSISPENLDGKKGGGGAMPWEQGSSREAARDLGTGWKVNPRRFIPAHQTLTLADVQDEGEITQIWLTPTGCWRGQVLRFYWDGETTPAVEVPLGDFFACGMNQYAQVSSLPVCVNPGSAFNCYWSMPFRKGFRITLENRNDEEVVVYYQINYLRKKVAEDAGYFHAQFRRVNPLPYKQDFTMLDNIHGTGHYVGTYMVWGSNSNGWWGEGEVKMYLDGDKEYPSICYTGTEDYFCGSYDFEDPVTHDRYVPFTTPYCGLCQVITPNTLYRSQMRFGLYRWHITDPVYFEKDIRVTIQALGWRSGGRYLPLQDDLSCVSYFYLDKPSCQLPPLGTADDWELV